MKYKQWNVKLNLAEYENGRTAIQMVDADDGMPIAVCTVNLPDQKVNEDETFIKNWSENKGMLEWLKTHGIVKEVIGYAKTGFVEAPKVRLNIDKLKQL